MKRNLFFLICAVLLVGCGKPQSAEYDLTTDKGVVIGGLKWATRNVKDNGTFVEKPEGFGTYYLFDHAQTACPVGWRTPTTEEFQSLVSSGYEWTEINGIKGGLFGYGENKIFLPAAGYREPSSAKYRNQGISGEYWSSTFVSKTMANGYDYLLFDDGNAKVSDQNFSYYLQARCVAN